MMVELRHAFRKGMAEHVPQRGHQAHLGQGFRHHAMGNAPHLRTGGGDGLHQPGHLGAFDGFGKGKTLRLHPKATKLLAHAVVQLAGDPPPLLLRRGDGGLDALLAFCDHVLLQPVAGARTLNQHGTDGQQEDEPQTTRKDQVPGALAFQFRLLDRAAGTLLRQFALRALRAVLHLHVGQLFQSLGRAEAVLQHHQGPLFAECLLRATAAFQGDHQTFQGHLLQPAIALPPAGDERLPVPGQGLLQPALVGQYIGQVDAVVGGPIAIIGLLCGLEREPVVVGAAFRIAPVARHHAQVVRQSGQFAARTDPGEKLHGHFSLLLGLRVALLFQQQVRPLGQRHGLGIVRRPVEIGNGLAGHRVGDLDLAKQLVHPGQVPQGLSTAEAVPGVTEDPQGAQVEIERGIELHQFVVRRPQFGAGRPHSGTVADGDAQREGPPVVDDGLPDTAKPVLRDGQVVGGLCLQGRVTETAGQTVRLTGMDQCRTGIRKAELPGDLAQGPYAFLPGGQREHTEKTIQLSRHPQGRQQRPAKQETSGGTAHNGMLPCFFRGSLSTLFSSMRRAWINLMRVSLGRTTSSMKPRAAAS